MNDAEIIKEGTTQKRMKLSDLQAISALLSGIKPNPTVYVRLNKTLQRTRFLFGPNSEIEGKRLRVIERNEYGDCMCIVEDEKGNARCLVDVDHVDIEQ